MAVVYLWTGEGWGKTTSAIGACIRAAGHGYKTVVVQFMKGRKDKIGEYKAGDLLGENYEIRQFGREEWVDLKNPDKEDKELALKGLDFARQAVRSRPFILVLDEINLAVAVGLLEEKEVLDFLDSVPGKVHIYLTGRRATKGLLDRADYVNEIIMRKGPKKMEGEKGIDY